MNKREIKIFIVSALAGYVICELLKMIFVG